MIVPTYIYRAIFMRIIDADTYVMDIDLGMRVHNQVNIRLHGFFAPEASSLAGQDATLKLIKIVENSKSVIVQTYKDQLSFARWIADVYIDGEHLGDLLRKAGVIEGGIGVK